MFIINACCYGYFSMVTKKPNFCNFDRKCPKNHISRHPIILQPHFFISTCFYLSELKISSRLYHIVISPKLAEKKHPKKAIFPQNIWELTFFNIFDKSNNLDMHDQISMQNILALPPKLTKLAKLNKHFVSFHCWTGV